MIVTREWRQVIYEEYFLKNKFLTLFIIIEEEKFKPVCVMNVGIHRILTWTYDFSCDGREDDLFSTTDYMSSFSSPHQQQKLQSRHTLVRLKPKQLNNDEFISVASLHFTTWLFTMRKRFLSSRSLMIKFLGVVKF